MADKTEELEEYASTITNIASKLRRKARKASNTLLCAECLLMREVVLSRLNYLRRYHDDKWIAQQIGVKAREFRRWEKGQCLPDTNIARYLPSKKNKRSLKTVYYDQLEINRNNK